MNQTYERIKGTLIGCAYGDAMGMPSEMMTREILSRAFPDGIHHFEKSSPHDFFGRKFAAGTVTDDTINTLLVCDTILDNHGEFETVPYLKRLQTWMDDNAKINPYVIGPSTAKALDAIKKGTPISEAGKYGTTNGSAMKVSPLGIIYDYHDVKGFVDKVERLCLPTHHTNIAIAGASWAAACVSYAIRGGSDYPQMFAMAQTILEEGMHRGTQLPCASLLERMSCIKELKNIQSDAEFYQRLENFYGSGMEVIETIPAAYAILLRSNGRPKQTAMLCANMSGDSDTIGAIATAIAGSMNPEFDTADITVLKEENNIDFDDYTEKLIRYVK